MKSIPTPILTLPDVLAALSKAVGQAGSQAQWCVENNVSTAYVSDVLNGRRDPGKKILDVLGVEPVTVYRPKATRGKHEG